jgi:hypothetical protein
MFVRPAFIHGWIDRHAADGIDRRVSGVLVMAVAVIVRHGSCL